MEQEKNKAAISFKGYKITNVQLTADNNADESKREIEVQLGINATIVNDKEFSVDFKVNVTDVNNDFSVDVNLVAKFSTDETIDESFIDSDFIKINAPAIVFPYLRAFITNLTVSSGYSPIILPTLNFTTK